MKNKKPEGKRARWREALARTHNEASPHYNLQRFSETVVGASIVGAGGYLAYKGYMSWWPEVFGVLPFGGAIVAEAVNVTRKSDNDSVNRIKEQKKAAIVTAIFGVVAFGLISFGQAQKADTNQHTIKNTLPSSEPTVSTATAGDCKVKLPMSTKDGAGIDLVETSLHNHIDPDTGKPYYRPAKQDETFGPVLHAAISARQQDIGLTPTGDLDLKTCLSLDDLVKS